MYVLTLSRHDYDTIKVNRSLEVSLTQICVATQLRHKPRRQSKERTCSKGLQKFLKMTTQKDTTTTQLRSATIDGVVRENKAKKRGCVVKNDDTVQTHG